MKKANQNFEITIATDPADLTLLYFREGKGPWVKAKISDIPDPLLKLLTALDEGKRVKINLAEVVHKTA